MRHAIRVNETSVVVSVEGVLSYLLPDAVKVIIDRSGFNHHQAPIGKSSARPRHGALFRRFIDGMHCPAAIYGLNSRQRAQLREIPNSVVDIWPFTPNVCDGFGASIEAGYIVPILIEKV